MDLLQVKNLKFTYPGESQKIIDNVSFSVKSGDFIVICGETGCGKTTLLRMLKRELTPVGERSGSIYYDYKPLEELSEARSATEIGFVMQKPENQIVTHKVWHEISFGLENMGLPTPVIRRRVSEISSYFGIGDWFHKDISELSGGQKQLLNLAAVMVMQPKVLILDEPTAQLDPITAADFIATLHKLNREFSLTIILVEHRTEEVLPIADKVLFMKKGRLIHYDTPHRVVEQMDAKEPMLSAMPSAVRLYHAFHMDVPCPLTVKEGRRFIEDNFTNDIRTLPKPRKDDKEGQKKVVALEVKDVWFRYEKNGPDILKGATFKVYQSEILCILGGNASGKTTMLGVTAGMLKAYSGTVSLFGKKLQSYKKDALYKNNLALLPQDVGTVFTGNTVQEDLKELGAEDIVLPFDIGGLLHKHPYDLSGGEQQLCALAKILQQKPRILLLDEPTKGIDAYAKQGILQILQDLRAMGMTIILVTHDVEFAASCADRCAMFFDGDVVSEDAPEIFFKENNYYTTAANRMTRHIYDNIVTVADTIEICRLNGNDLREERSYAL